VYSGHGFVNTSATADLANSVNGVGSHPGPQRVDRETLEVIDREHLARQTGRDSSLQRDVLTLFVAQLRDLLAMLQATDPDPQYRMTELLHRQKGAAAAVGAAELATALARAEEAIVDGRLPEAAARSVRDVAWSTVDAARGIIAAQPSRSLAKDGQSL
jgi:HPt (histidine-containing phosphotransfer) domain-containing protein